VWDPGRRLRTPREIEVVRKYLWQGASYRLLSHSLLVHTRRFLLPGLSDLTSNMH
jgi:hypothetical protein